MALPETIRSQVDKLLPDYCLNRVPPHARAQIVNLYEVRGNAVTIFETRPPWRADMGPEWTKRKVAQIRYDPVKRTWSMWWADRNGKWLCYEDFAPSPDLKDCLRQLDEDLTGAFWG